jgi:hypothetical protein
MASPLGFILVFVPEPSEAGLSHISASVSILEQGKAISFVVGREKRQVSVLFINSDCKTFSSSVVRVPDPLEYEVWEPQRGPGRAVHSLLALI